MRIPVGILVAVLACPAVAADWSFREPTDIRTILLAISTAGNVNLLIGGGVEGLTTYEAKNKPAEQALVEAATSAGFTVRKRDNLLAVRLKGISPDRVDEDPPHYFRRTETVALKSLTPASTHALMAQIGRQLKVPVRVHRLATGTAIANFHDVPPRTFMNVFCEAMGYGWGTARNVLVVAQWHRARHYVIEMGVDGRTE